MAVATIGYVQEELVGGEWGVGGRMGSRTHTPYQFVLCYKVKEIRVKYGFGIAWFSVVSPAYNIVVIVVFTHTHTHTHTRARARARARIFPNYITNVCYFSVIE